jgi:hypothetical protein
MSSSATAPQATTRASCLIWEGLWHGNDINIVILFSFFSVAWVLYGGVATGLTVLALLCPALAIRSRLREAGQGGRGAARAARSAT